MVHRSSRANARGSVNPNRYAGGRVAWVLALIVVSGFSLAMWRFFATRFPTGPVVGFVALGSDEVLVFRESDNEAFAVEMVRVHREDGPQWRKGIYKLQFRPPEGITVGDGIITVRALDVEGHLETHVFSDDGKFLFRRRAFAGPVEVGAFQGGGASVRSPGSVYELYLRPELKVHQVRLPEANAGADFPDDESMPVPESVSQAVKVGAPIWTEVAKDTVTFQTAEGGFRLLLGSGTVESLDSVSQAGREVSGAVGPICRAAGSTRARRVKGPGGLVLQSEEFVVSFDAQGRRLATARMHGTSLSGFPVFPEHVTVDRLWLANEADVRPFEFSSLRPLRSVGRQPSLEVVDETPAFLKQAGVCAASR